MVNKKVQFRNWAAVDSESEEGKKERKEGREKGKKRNKREGAAEDGDAADAQ